MSRLAAIVLCGGASRRMGRPKSDLPFGPETLLERAVRLISAVADPVIVAAAPRQELPDFDGRPVRIVRDAEEHWGPLHGVASALAAVPDGVELVYLAAVDTPHFSTAWLRLLVDKVEGHEAAAAVVEGRPQPFAALYRVEPAREAARGLLRQGDERLTMMLNQLRTRKIDDEELASIDPSGEILRDLDRQEDYRRALENWPAKRPETGPAGARFDGPEGLS